MTATATPEQRAARSHDVPVAVVDADASFCEDLTEQLGDRLIASFRSLPALGEHVPPNTPMVVILGPAHASPEGVKALGAFTRSRPEAGAILLVPRLSAKLLQTALRTGIRDVLSVPVDAAELCAAVDRVGGSLHDTDSSLSKSRAEPGRLITVFSAKGGVGKSVLSSNLAVALAAGGPDSVVLVDLDLQFGDAAVLLDLAPTQTIVGAISPNVDSELLRGLLIRHEPSGALVLPAPLEPSLADAVSVAYVMAILEVLRTMFAFVIVDTPAHLNDVVVSVLEESDEIMLVSALEVPSVKNAKLALQTLRLLNVPTERVKLVLNRSNPKNRFEVSEVERVLQAKAEGVIPLDPAVPAAVNRGVPVVLDAPKSRAARAIEQLGADVAARAATTD